MRRKKLEWYVLCWDFNSKKMIKYNIFAELIIEDLMKEVKAKRVYNKSILREYLKTQFMYYYWSKVEYEFFASDLNGMKYEKIDVWRQIEPNLDIIVDYINLELNLKFE